MKIYPVKYLTKDAIKRIKTENETERASWSHERSGIYGPHKKDAEARQEHGCYGLNETGGIILAREAIRKARGL